MIRGKVRDPSIVHFPLIFPFIKLFGIIGNPFRRFKYQQGCGVDLFLILYSFHPCDHNVHILSEVTVFAAGKITWIGMYFSRFFMAVVTLHILYTLLIVP